MRVLFVACHFAPDAAIGGMRPYPFARLLPDDRIQSWIRTVEPQFVGKRDCDTSPDGMLARNMPSNVYCLPNLEG